MANDLRALLLRDHRDLERGLDELVAAESLREIRTTLDGIRLGLAAHSEAEEIVLHHAATRCSQPDELRALVAKSCAAHRLQAAALGALLCEVPGSALWRDRARWLRDLVHEHDLAEERYLLHPLRELDGYRALAGEFATERLRQLSMLAPSAPVFMHDLAVAV
jgi:hypothetical protein